jgi:hypothetical protein
MIFREDPLRSFLKENAFVYQALRVRFQIYVKKGLEKGAPIGYLVFPIALL